MDKSKTVKSIISILDNIDFNDKVEITMKQLITCMDLIDAVGVDVSGVKSEVSTVCTHPKDSLINLTCLGSDEVKLQCIDCGEVIINKK